MTTWAAMGALRRAVGIAQGLDIRQRRLGRQPRGCALVEPHLDFRAGGIVMRAAGQLLELEVLGRALRDR